MDLLVNFPLISALSAIVIAQVIKIPLHLIVTRDLKLDLAFSTGGMPSSHSAAVSSLTTAIGITNGIDSPIFAVSAVFSVIVMYDASGIRRQAGEQAVIINQLINDFQSFVTGTKDWKDKEPLEKREELKEIMGHRPIEVFFGSLTGIGIAFLIHQLY